jgi:uncharacterized protein YdhG (YjbR/CyaY superfamily)
VAEFERTEEADMSLDNEPDNEPGNRPTDPLDEHLDATVRDYIAAIPAEHRPLFDRLHALIRRADPEAAVVLAYGMPTYRSGKRRLHLGVWRHGVSLYGWRRENDGGFLDRHPKLRTSTGTIRLRPEDAADISDAEFLDLIRPALTE